MRYHVYEILVGNWGILASVLLVAAGLIRMFRGTFDAMFFDNNPRYRLVSRIAIGTMLGFMLWVTLFDNWRQVIGVLTGYLHSAKMQAGSDPFFETPASDAVRAVTWVLFFATALAGAYLFARYTRSYLAPIIAFPTALVTFYILNTFRIRLDPESVRIADGPIVGIVENFSTLIWVAGLWTMFAALILCVYALAWSPAAIIFSIVYRRTLGREIIDESDFYQKLHERTARRREAGSNSA